MFYFQRIVTTVKFTSSGKGDKLVWLFEMMGEDEKAVAAKRSFCELMSTCSPLSIASLDTTLETKMMEEELSCCVNSSITLTKTILDHCKLSYNFDASSKGTD